MPHYAKGAAAAEAAAKSMSGRRADFLSVKSGQRVIVRPLTDLDYIATVDVHMGVPTKPHPKNVKEDKWPSEMSAVCQNSTAYRIHDEQGEPTDEWEEGYGHCYIHEHMKDIKGRYKRSVAIPTSQTWGLFAIREPIMEGGKLVGFKDVTEEFKDKEGKVHHIPRIVVASQSYTNFWAHFKAAAYMTGTICDRDFSIERTDNEYTVQAGREVPGLLPGEPAWQRYTDALEIKDLSVEKVLADQSSAEYYGRFFDPAWVDETEEEGGTAAESEEAAAAAESTLSDEEAERMKGEMAAAFAPPTTT